MKVAMIVAKDADTEDALALSEAALWVLPKLNPYAEKFYDFSGTDSSARQSRQALTRLADEYENGIIKLGRAMVAIAPQTSSLNPELNTTIEEDYGSLANR